MESETMRRMFSGELGPDRDFFIYSRHFNPTVLNLARQMAALEGTEAAYCTSSGMSPVSSMLLQLYSSGGHVVASQTLYGGTHALLTHFFPRACNITTTFVDLRDLEMVKEAIVRGKTKVLYANSAQKKNRGIRFSLGDCEEEEAISESVLKNPSRNGHKIDVNNGHKIHVNSTEFVSDFGSDFGQIEIRVQDDDEGIRQIVSIIGETSVEPELWNQN
ncbi:methionine gamma-lyase-like [Camellia sinensis]|uniref:methionine gamma-lyase-like n=1 Tax=Camellia sinensis TaxID=4442 RepID=UPI001035A9F5|nr:methionine gamma-lyase-like [Camellia sinensis]